MSQLRELYRFITLSAEMNRKEINICIRDSQGNIIKTNKRSVYGY
ncbi:hypothetical protein FM109_00675 [Vibrio casei]|nr:hypothetical protein FM109_00675 [Vibrio casei]